MTSDVNPAYQGGLRDTLISIQDAANTAKESVLFLLDEASKGRLELLIECRAGRRLVLRPDRPALEKEVLGVPHPWRTPDYLALGSDVCRILTFKPSTYFAETSYGYRHEPGRAKEFVRLYASEADDSEKYPVQVDGKDSPKPQTPINRWGRWTSWALWTGGQVEAVPLRRDDIFLRLRELYRWLDIDPRAVPLGRSKPNDDAERDQLDNEYYKSDQLRRMHEASLNLWGNDKVLPNDPSTHPTTEQAIRWFGTTGDFTPTQAANAAALIKPSWGNRGGRPQK